MNKFLMTLAVLSSTASAVMAQGATWDASENRGLKLYTASQGSVKASLVCDPDNLWEPAEYHLQVQSSGAVLPGNSVTVSAGEESVTVPLSGGAILSNDRESWNKILAMLAAPGKVTFAAGDVQVQLDFASETTLNCLRPME